MSLQTCIAEAKAWAKENADIKLRGPDIEQMGRLLQAAYDAGATPAQRMEIMNNVVNKRIALYQAEKQGDSYLNATKNLSNFSNIKRNIETWSAEKANGKPGMPEGDAAVNAMKAQITGQSSRPGFGVNQDPVAAYRGALAQNLGYLKNSMTPAEFKLFQSLDKADAESGNLFQELSALRHKEQSGQSGSDIALSLARKLREAQDAMFKDAQALNPYLKENNTYLASRSWNRDLVSKATRDEFIQKTMGRFGNGLIGDDAEKAEIFGAMYDEIKAGVPPESKDLTPRFWEPKSTGGNQAMQNAGQRVLIANDWKAEFESNAEFGDSLYNSYLKQAQRLAEYTSGVNKWGTQYADNFKTLFSKVASSIKDPEQKAVFLREKESLKQLFDTTMGAKNSEIWSTAGRLNQGFMGAENLAYLGNHLPRVLGSNVAAIAQVKNAYGLNFMEATTELARGMANSIIKTLPGGDPHAAIQELSVMSSAVARDMSGQISLGNMGENSLGKAAALARGLGKLTLADRTSSAFKFAMAEADTRMLAKRAGSSFEELHPQTQELLARYDLAGANWEVARQGVVDGRLTTDGIRAIPDEVFKDLLGDEATGRQIRLARVELSQNYATLLNDRASMTVAESNAASRATAYGGTDPNTAEGIVRRWLMQFRQAALVRQDLMQRVYRSGGGNTSNISGTLQYGLGMAFMGMLGQQLVELGAGREPLSPSDPKIVGHMLRSTGLLGLYGDVIADALTHPPQKASDLMEGDMLGPSIGTGLKIANATSRTLYGAYQGLKGEDKKNQYGQAQWGKLITGLTPDQNLFYAKGAVDYLFLNEMHEFLGDSGYMGQLRKQLKNSTNLSGDEQQFTFGGQNFWE